MAFACLESIMKPYGTDVSGENGMDITEVREHEDGGATYVFDMTKEEMNIMAKEGVKLALLLSICEMNYADLAKMLIEKREQSDSE
jgi:hypothetical protein